MTRNIRKYKSLIFNTLEEKTTIADEDLLLIDPVYCTDNRLKYYIEGDSYPTAVWSAGYYRIDPIINFIS